MEKLNIFLAVLVFVALVAFMVVLSKKIKASFTIRVMTALVLGLAYGSIIQWIFGVADSEAKVPNTSVAIVEWVNLLGTGFTRGLQFVIAPLVFVSIVAAIAKLGQPGQGIKKAVMIISFLLITTAIAALVSIGVVRIFNFNINNLVKPNLDAGKADSIPDTVLKLIPSNLFAAFSGSAVLPIVFISVVIGFAYLDVKKHKPHIGAKFESFLDTAYDIVLKLVDYVIGFTPYGILAIISVRSASAGWEFMAQLGIVVLVSFVAMAIMFAIHLIISAVAGVSPARWIKKSSAALLFSFSSRSSSATVPLTIQAQRKLGVSEGNANLAASFGTCIGQNACAGLYPAMVAILAGLAQGWDVWSAGFIIPLVLYCVISSIGTAGIGGGATNVSLMVLGLMGLPIEIVTILLAVDFIIDMGRTAVNVNDSILAGFVVGRIEKDIDNDVLFDRKDYDHELRLSEKKDDAKDAETLLGSVIESDDSSVNEASKLVEV